MKDNNTVEACTHCHVCQNQCEFLKKYGIDIGDTEKLKELSYHCFLCGKCTEVCPENIDGREYILNLRREKVEKSGGTLEEKGYGMLLKEKKIIYTGITDMHKGKVFCFRDVIFLLFIQRRPRGW